MKTTVKWLLAATTLISAVSCSSTRQTTGQQGNDAYYDPNYPSNQNQDDYYNDAYTDDQNATEPDVTYNDFYNELSPYGSWMNYPAYGQVWVCRDPGFVPYSTGGHWAYTNYGWTWVSDYSWGWAPFHYGRWAFEPAFGWMWVPGYQWAPAWVSWRSSADYYGWAPLGPGISVGINVNIPADRWMFVPCRYITNPNLHNYYVNRSQNITIINNTRIINNTNNYRNVRYVAGPDRRDVERIVQQPIRPMRVSSAARPGRAVSDGRTLSLYRPSGRINNNTTPANNFSNGNGTNPRITPGQGVRPGTANPQQPVQQQPNNNRPFVRPGVTNPPPVNNNNPVNNTPANNNQVRPQTQQPVFNRPSNPVNNAPQQQQPQVRPQPQVNQQQLNEAADRNRRLMEMRQQQQQQMQNMNRPGAQRPLNTPPPVQQQRMQPQMRPAAPRPAAPAPRPSAPPRSESRPSGNR